MSNPSPTGSLEPLNNPSLTITSNQSNASQMEDKNPEELLKKTEDFFATCMELLQNLKAYDKENQQYELINMEKIMVQIDFLQRTLTTEIIPKIIEQVKREDAPGIQNEAFSLLAKICDEETQQTSQITEKKAVETSSPQPADQEKSVNTIKRMADRREFEDILLANGAFKLLLQILNEAYEHKIEKVLEKGPLALATLCKGKKIGLSEVKSAAGILVKIADQSEAPKVIFNTLIGLICLPGFYVDTEFFLEAETYSPFIKHLQSSDTELVLLILKVLDNVPRCTGTNELFETPEMLEKLFHLVQHKEEEVRRETLDVFYEKPLPDSLFNFFINNPRYLKKLIQIGSTDTFEIRRESVMLLSFMALNANVDEVTFLAKIGVLKFLHQLMKRKEDEELCVEAGIEREERRQIIELFSIVEQRNAEMCRLFK